MAQEQFLSRHIGPREEDVKEMLKVIGVDSVEALLQETVPENIRLKELLDLPKALTEAELFARIKEIGSKNKLYRSFIGLGYYDTITPAVILRNVLENATWYTSYTPYQAEVSQGRLEALLNFQTMVLELTKMELTNCSLHDEAQATAEAMNMMINLRTKAKKKAKASKVFVDNSIYTQTKSVLETRANPQNIEIVYGDYKTFEFTEDFFGAIVQYPTAEGNIRDYKEFVAKCHENELLTTVVADLMSLAILTPPGEWDADIVCGTTQRMGIPMGYGGPAAGYIACRAAYKRQIPGRIIGVTVDAQGSAVLRLSLQSREQHIKREKASSNICTAQALMASMVGFFGVYHGKEGLVRIAKHINSSATILNEEISKLGYTQTNANYFDTLRFELPEGVKVDAIKEMALEAEMNFNYFEEGFVSISTDEKMSEAELSTIINIFAKAAGKTATAIETINEVTATDESLLRTDDYMTQDVFNTYRSETAMMRYIKQLERKDIGLNNSMISLGSCTMKLNAASEMLPISWPEFGGLHPFIPANQANGYHELIEELERWLSVITGFAGCSLQPNSGAAGEYAGLMTIRQYHIAQGQGHRNVVLIPASAHGTNPASSSMAGLKIIIVKCDDKGNIDVEDFRAKAIEHKDDLSCTMITYPSTHGIFEESIKELMDIVHENGGQVYMDGANMNGQCGLTSPGYIGADVCHLNLHKTFAMPHGGGGPGVGPICVAEHLVKHLPSHQVIDLGIKQGSAVSAAPYGSPLLLPITYGYIAMLGAEGIAASTTMAILNANYLTSAFEKLGFQILFKGEHGRVGHEMIWDCNHFNKEVGISELDIAKRLMDFGFHAPTLSFPVHGTLMVEPTESEPKEELDRFIEALKTIRNEIIDVEEGRADKVNNVLKNAPHTHMVCTATEWDRPYTREQAAYPLKWVIENKFWIGAGRVDDGYGDRNLQCTCAPLEDYRNSNK